VRIGGKIGTCIAVSLLVVGIASPASAGQNWAGGKKTAPVSQPLSQTVTLISGDQVTLQRGKLTAVRPGAGREKMTFSRFASEGHNYVVPADAMRLVSSGRLDRRLFDVTALVEFGYDDARRDTLPLIVTHPAGRAAPRVASAEVSRELPSINGTAMSVDKGSVAATWDALTGSTAGTLAAGVSTVWLDGKRKATLDRSAAQIGAPSAWEAGFTGEGVKVAVLDTGVDQTHPDLADREIAEENFTDAPDNDDDTIGHGTHVASIVAGTGAKSGGKYRGIAHGASIMDGKVFDDFGFSQDSWIVAGMEWAAQEGADVVNMSLGGGDTTAVDPLEAAVGELTAKFGTLFVIAAGNDGPGAQTVGSPGSAPEALTVGAVERTDALADFSSRGPTAQDGVIKPDVTAPGVDIVAALHSAGTIAPPVEDGYTALSGTSMATPHVAGAAALLAQQRPDLTAAELKAVLSASATPTPGLGAFAQGSGRIDVTRALDQTVVTEPSSVHVGTVAWPHDDDTPVSRTVTYRNLDDAAVTLDLAVDAIGPNGAPADVFSLSADQLTVPAGGEAQVTVTGDVAEASLDGDYSGAITATAGDLVSRTPVVVNREPESYDLTLNYTDDKGAPTSAYFTFLLGLDVDRVVLPYDADGSLTLRLPKGRYLADHAVFNDEDAKLYSFLQPGLDLDQDLTVEVDPAVTRPIDITPPAEAILELGDIGYQFQLDNRIFVGGPIFSDPGAVSTAQLGEELAEFPVTNWINTQWDGVTGDFYGLAWFTDRFPTGFTKAVSRRELATVRSRIGDAGLGGDGFRSWGPQPPSGSAFTLAAGLPVPQLPATRRAYLTTEDLRWQSGFQQQVIDVGPVAVLQSPYRSYRAGRTYDERVNFPVFGPAFPPIDAPWSSRDSEGILINIPLFSDSGGNAGFSLLESASTKLFLGDELLGEFPTDGFGFFTGLPAESRTYRLTTEATRPDLFGFTSAVRAEWTFTSSQVDGPEVEPIDMNVVRFLPKLDDEGAAPAGRSFLVPVQVQDETGATTRPRRLTIEVSYDEGASWRRAPVSESLVAKLDHPAGAKSVSLRASATDREGNTVKQTVIKAYTLR
jgi:Subtilase family